MLWSLCLPFSCILFILFFGFNECICIKQINTGSSLASLGTLVAGVPSYTIENIPASQLLTVSQSATFVSNIQAAPTIVQQIFVDKVQIHLLLPPHVHSWFWNEKRPSIFRHRAQLGERRVSWSELEYREHFIPGWLICCHHTYIQVYTSEWK